MVRSATTVGVTLAGCARGEEGGDLLGDDRGGTAPTSASPVWVADLVGQRREARAGRRRVDPRRAGSTSCGSARSISASGRSRLARAAANVVGGDHQAGGAGAGDHDVGLGQHLLGTSASGTARPPYCSASRCALAAVRLATTTSATPRRRAVATASAAIDPAPDHERPLAGERTDLLRRALESRDTETRDGAALVDVGLGVGPLADPERLLEERVQGGPDRAGLLADAQRVPGLAEDLPLADDHRVQSGRRRGTGATRRRRRSGRRGGGRPPRALRPTSSHSSRETASTLPWNRSTSA